MAMKPDIHAGSGMANAIAHNANATAHTMLANSEILGRNLSNIFETMNRNRALREQEEQRKLDNAYRENAFNYQKAADERNYNYQKERDLAKDNQWAKEYALQKETSNYDNRLKQAQADYYRNNKSKGDNEFVNAFFNSPMEQQTENTPQQESQPQVFLTQEVALKQAQQQTQPTQPKESYLSAQWEINQRKAQAPQQPSFLAQHRTQQDNGIPKMMAAVMNQNGQIKQPQIVMRSNNQYGNKEAELRKQLQERTAYLQELKGSK